jgi:hypothetical protein
MNSSSWLRPLRASFLALALSGLGGGACAAAQAAPSLASAQQTEAVILTRSALLALDQANKTGNYTVLRDLGSSTFHANSAAKLSEVFADLRRQNVDMSATLAQPLSFNPQPAVDAKGLLRVAGAVPLGARVLYFQIAWAREAGAWRIYGIVVTASETTP